MSGHVQTSQKRSMILMANKSIIMKNAATFLKVTASTSGADHNYTQDELTVIDQLSADESTIRANLDRASYEASLLRRISTLSFGSANTLSPPTISNNWYEQYTSTLDRQNSQQVSALKTQEESDLVASILLSFIMPILFGGDRRGRVCDQNCIGSDQYVDFFHQHANLPSDAGWTRRLGWRRCWV